MGIASFIIGLIGIFFLSFILSPLALLFGIIAIFQKQAIWGIFGIIFAIIGTVTSPVIMSLYFFFNILSLNQSSLFLYKTA